MKKILIAFASGIMIPLIAWFVGAKHTINIVFAKQFDLVAEITKYNPDPAQTDDTPLITASGKPINERTAACPEWLEFGTRILVDNKEYICEDRMNLRYRRGNYFDLAVMGHDDALRFGRQKMNVRIMSQ